MFLIEILIFLVVTVISFFLYGLCACAMFRMSISNARLYNHSCFRSVLYLHILIPQVFTECLFYGGAETIVTQTVVILTYLELQPSGK